MPSQSAQHKVLQQQRDQALQHSQLSLRQNRLLTLAAVFQSAHITFLLATQGKAALTPTTAAALNQLLLASQHIQANNPHSLFSLDYYHSISQLQLGIHALEAALTRPFQPNKSRLPTAKPYAETLRYATTLLHIERKVYRQTAFIDQITQQQQQLKQRLAFFDNNHRHPAILANIANLYLATAGTLNTRLNVRGKPSYLQDKNNVDCIRACLFTGLQAAHLWRQLGGNRWQLAFGRRAILQDIQYFAQQHYQQSDQRSTH